MEAGSVILQVASFKTREKNFRMSLIHHHFERRMENQSGHPFLDSLLLFALLGLATLKLR